MADHSHHHHHHHHQRVLIVATSHAVLGKTGYPTGVWLAEVVHPYHELRAAGIHVDIASIKGGVVPIDPYSDPRSPMALDSAKADKVCIEFLASAKDADKLKDSLKLSEVDGSKYAAVIFAGGNGAVFDFPNDPTIPRLIEGFIKRKSVVSSLCHGGAAWLKVNDEAGKPFVAGVQVTCFDNEEEAIARSQIGQDYLPFESRGVEDELTKLGASFSKAAPFTSHVVVGEKAGARLVFGQNNFSGEAVGKSVVAALKSA